MKRSWIGFALLLILLAVGLLTTYAMDRIHEPIEADLKRAAECAMLEDWENADRFFYRAKENWDASAHFRASLADHTPVEEIDGAFARLEVYCRAREDEDFAAGCCELAKKTAAVGDAHGLVWWNVL